MKQETEFDKFNRLAFAIAQGLDGEEAAMFARAKHDVLNYYAGLMEWLKGDLLKFEEQLAYACVVNAFGLTINRMLGGRGDTFIGDA